MIDESRFHDNCSGIFVPKALTPPRAGDNECRWNCPQQNRIDLKHAETSSHGRLVPIATSSIELNNDKAGK